MKDYKRVLPWIAIVLLTKVVAVALGYDFSVDQALSFRGAL